MTSMARSLSAVLAVVAALPLMGAGCTAQNICNMSRECQEEENDRTFSDDAAAVCAVDYDTRINALYANEEDECHALADAILALDNCKVGLKCDDFVEGDLGGECDDEVDDLDDAARDVDGDECSAQEN